MYEIKIFGFSFSAYWSLLIIAAIFTVILSIKRAKKYEISKRKAIIIAVLLILYGCIGAKLLYIAEYPNRAVSLRGGMSLFGSVYFIPIAFAITVILLKIKYIKCMDFIALYGPFIFAFMRIGCYLNGCCGGIEIVTATNIHFIPPVQLIECLFDVLIFCLLLYCENRKVKPGTGLQYPIFMVCYALIRFFIEFWRNTPKEIFGFSEGQWFSVITFALGAGIFWILKRKEDIS